MRSLNKSNIRFDYYYPMIIVVVRENHVMFYSQLLSHSQTNVLFLLSVCVLVKFAKKNFPPPPTIIASCIKQKVVRRKRQSTDGHSVQQSADQYDWRGSSAAELSLRGYVIRRLRCTCQGRPPCCYKKENCPGLPQTSHKC